MFGNLSIRFFVLWLCFLVAPVFGTTIDSMSIGTFGNYTQTFNKNWNGGTFVLFGIARQYTNSDGENWRSGAGWHPPLRVRPVGYSISDNKISYYFDQPATGVVFQNRDYSGQHSAQGVLRSDVPLVLTAEYGSSVSTITGFLEIALNEPANWAEPFFKYYSADVGDQVYFDITHELLNATWTENVFDSVFEYRLHGNVDFTQTIDEPSTMLAMIIGMLLVYARSSRTGPSSPHPGLHSIET